MDQGGLDLRIDELCEADIEEKGFLESLDNLIPGTSALGAQSAKAVWRRIKSNPLHKIFVARVSTGDHAGKDALQVAGTITLLVEPKFIFNGGMVGHIEDVSVRNGFERMGIGRILVAHAIKAADELKCVKLVLDCSDETMPFYEKLGFSYQDNCMKRINSGE
ncbi:MAG TPA: GNAT family N-acetyltransferase [Nitrososphaera sp.]|nr:GNAT family N-acetyltransferase [Nitrososphaera sp.]